MGEIFRGQRGDVRGLEKSLYLQHGQTDTHIWLISALGSLQALGLSKGAYGKGGSHWHLGPVLSL